MAAHQEIRKIPGLTERVIGRAHLSREEAMAVRHFHGLKTAGAKTQRWAERTGPTRYRYLVRLAVRKILGQDEGVGR